METNGIKTGYCPGEHRCMECGEPLGEYGRSDRKFCSPHCKDGYNNRKRHYLRGVRMRVETALSRNHSILERLFTLPDDTIVYPGHMDCTTIRHEKVYNPIYYTL